MTETQLRELAQRFAGSTLEIHFLVEVVCDQYDITPAAAWRLIVAHLPTNGGVVFL